MKQNRIDENDPLFGFCSGGKRRGHIPYRDSKLTRILQSSIGGNARTAIVCTMSPALSHVEQSRNTLSFATSAKEVTNNAQVNVVRKQNFVLLRGKRNSILWNLKFIAYSWYFVVLEKILPHESDCCSLFFLHYKNQKAWCFSFSNQVCESDQHVSTRRALN